MKTAVNTVSLTTLMKQRVCTDHKEWLTANPEATLGQLLTRLEKAHEQLLEFVDSGNPVIKEANDIPFTLAVYLSAWASHHGEPFSYREANVEEDIELVAELIEALGNEVRMAELQRELLALPGSTSRSVGNRPATLGSENFVNAQ